jgi:hypothetical protein
MDTFGAKLKVFGDAVYDQDEWWPQVAVGLQHKKNTEMAIPFAVGAKDDQGPISTWPPPRCGSRAGRWDATSC